MKRLLGMFLVFAFVFIASSTAQAINSASSEHTRLWRQIKQAKQVAKSQEVLKKSPCFGLKSFSGLPVLDRQLTPAIYVDVDLYHKVLKRAEWACKVRQSRIAEYFFEEAKKSFDKGHPSVLIIKIHVIPPDHSGNAPNYLFTYIKKGYDKK